MKAALLAMLVALSAPYQCASDDERPPVEDSAPQALWLLAERFKAEGNLPARQTTLNQLIETYPSSRYAQRARQELGIPDPAAP